MFLTYSSDCLLEVKEPLATTIAVIPQSYNQIRLKDSSGPQSVEVHICGHTLGRERRIQERGVVAAVQTFWTVTDIDFTIILLK